MQLSTVGMSTSSYRFITSLTLALNFMCYNFHIFKSFVMSHLSSFFNVNFNLDFDQNSLLVIANLHSYAYMVAKLVDYD